MALEDFRVSGCNLHEVREVFAPDLHVDEREDRQTDFDGINLCAISEDDTGFFHLAYAFGDCRCGESDATAQLGETDAGVLLHLVEDIPTDVVEQVFGFMNRRGTSGQFD